MQENLQAFIYIKNIKNTSRNLKKLHECHCIGKRLKYPRISLKITKMPLAARTGEGVAGERREMLWVMLRWERKHGTPVQLRPVIRWISGGKIMRLWLARSAGWLDGPDEQRWDRVRRGTPKSRYTRWRGATGSKLRLFQGLRCVWVLIWCDKPYCIY